MEMASVTLRTAWWWLPCHQIAIVHLVSKNHHLMSHFRYSIFYTVFSILCPVEGGVLLDMSLGFWCNEDKLVPLVSKSARTASVSTSEGF